jgi:cyclopropane fatty-acyl-phospholipid synthase-like methyltransferase
MQRANLTWSEVWKAHDYSDQDLRSRKATYKLGFFEKCLRQRLPAQPRVLDVGCGSGAWINAILNVWPNAMIVGIDVSEEAISRARQLVEIYPGQVQLLNIDLESYSPPEEGFDPVLCIGVLEHSTNWQAFTGKLQAALGRAGALLSIHSGSHSPFPIERRLRQFLGRWPFGPQSEASKGDMVRLAANIGLRVLKASSIPCNEDRALSMLDRLWNRLSGGGRYIAILATRDNNG